MNFDLIIKLIRLANNNPNENEANLAARKVCTMLKDHSFNQVSTPKQNPYQRPPNEPQPAYSKPPNPDNPFGGFGNHFWDQFFNQRDQERAREYYKRPPKEAYVRPPNERYYSKDDNYAYTSPKEQAKKEDRDLKCKTCGKVTKTKFVGLVEVFECNTCQWTAYEKVKENRSL